ncbi:MAG: DMT family transporter [Burkholderiaceae bacterium]
MARKNTPGKPSSGHQGDDLRVTHSGKVTSGSDDPAGPGGPHASLQGYFLLFAGMTLVGCYVALSKPLTAIMPVFLLAWFRFAIGAIAMAGWLRPGTDDQPLTRNLLGALFLQSFFGNFLFSICMLYGISMTSATASGVILSSMPAIVALLSWLLLRESLSTRIWLAIGLAVAGVALLTLFKPAVAPGAPESTLAWLGNLLVFSSVVCESIYVILGKRLTGALSPRRISALINLWGLALMTPVGLWHASQFDFATLDGASWALLIFYALAASQWSTWLWLSGLKSVPASQSGVFTIAMPLAATAIGVSFLGESLHWIHALAFALACAGILLITTDRRPNRANRA